MDRSRRFQILALMNLILVTLENANAVTCGYTDDVMQRYATHKPTHKCPEHISDDFINKECKIEWAEECARDPKKCDANIKVPLFCKIKGQVQPHCRDAQGNAGAKSKACKEAAFNPKYERLCAQSECTTPKCNANSDLKPCSEPKSGGCGCVPGSRAVTTVFYRPIPIDLKRTSREKHTQTKPRQKAWWRRKSRRTTRKRNFELGSSSKVRSQWVSSVVSSVKSAAKKAYTKVKTVASKGIAAVKSAAGCLVAKAITPIVKMVAQFAQKEIELNAPEVWDNEIFLKVVIEMIKTQKYQIVVCKNPDDPVSSCKLKPGKAIHGSCLGKVKETFVEALTIFSRDARKSLKGGKSLRIASKDIIPAVGHGLGYQPSSVCAVLSSLCRTWNVMSDPTYPTFALPDNQGIASYLDNPAGAATFRVWAVRAKQEWYTEVTKRYACNSYMEALRAAAASQCHYRYNQKCKRDEIPHKDTSGNTQHTCCLVLSVQALTKHTCLFYNPYPKGKDCPFVPSATNKSASGFGYDHFGQPNGLTNSIAINALMKQKEMAQHKPEKLCKASTSPSVVSEPICAGFVELRVEHCSTCCCKDGIINSGASSQEVIRNHPNCAMWFSGLVDYFMRFILGYVRNIVQMNQMRTCLVKGCTKVDKLTGHCKD